MYNCSLSKRTVIIIIVIITSNQMFNNFKVRSQLNKIPKLLGRINYFYLLQYLLLLCVIFTHVPGLPPEIPFESYTASPPISLDGVPVSNIMDTAEAVLTGDGLRIKTLTPGGEDLFYVAIEGGFVIKHHKGELTYVARTGKPCIGPFEEYICGRPSGMRMEGSSGKLILADHYLGILKVDPVFGKTHPVFPFKAPIGGKVPLYANDLDLSSKTGKIYWSDSSTLNEHNDIWAEFLSNTPSGRLIEYNPVTKENRVLLDNIHYASGVQLSKNEDFVLVVETMRSRVLRYWLEGPLNGTEEVFIDGLPGVPDGIRPNANGGFYMPMTEPRELFFDTLGPLPFLRKFISRIRAQALRFAFWLEDCYPTSLSLKQFRVAVANMGPFASLQNFPRQEGYRVLEMNEHGNVIRVFESRYRRSFITHFVQFVAYRDYAYVGCQNPPRIWKVRMGTSNQTHVKPA